MDHKEAQRMVGVHYRLKFPLMEVGEARLVSEEPLVYVVGFFTDGEQRYVEVRGTGPEDSVLLDSE